MMDEESKIKFKMKFYYLAVQMNVIILLVALSVLAFFIIPGQNRIPLIIVLIVMALVLSLNFRKKYKETKVWLDEHTDKGKDI
jgi:cell division protein FtsW (lipid II flippase)